MKLKENNIINLFKSDSSVNKCIVHTNKYYRPYDAGKYLYNMLQKYSGAFLDEDHIQLIFVTLNAWGMNSRSAKLYDYETFRRSLKKERKLLLKLRTINISDLDNVEFEIVFKQLHKLFESLKISKTKTRLVAFSKTLHFILPNLVMPIDGKYTIRFFYNTNNVNYKTQFYDFIEIHKMLRCISLRYKLNKYVNNSWNANIPKILDNAIIGYVNTKIIAT